MTTIRTIILAAGRGTRMKSDIPKVLHLAAGRYLINYVLDIAKQLRSLNTYVVVGYQGDAVKSALGDGLTFVAQDQQRGTGDAVKRTKSYFKNYSGDVLILCGDTPLLSGAIVRQLVAKHRRTKATLTLLIARVAEPHGYGRIVRDAQGQISAIVEQSSLQGDQTAINEINAGVYCVKSRQLFEALAKIKPNPQKNEVYLTDAVHVLLKGGHSVQTLVTDDPTVAFGVNNRRDLAQAEAVLRYRCLNDLMDSGVTIVDPSTTYIENGARIGRDTIIYPCTMIHSDVTIGRNCQIGPFARIRPGTQISDGVHVGNFAELSRSQLGQGVYMKHFSFVGDARVGRGVNIGAGTVTANYDGKNKNVTTIGDGAFIGSDSILVAPVKIGKKAIVGAGSVVTKGKNVPDGKKVVGVPARVIG